MNRKRGQSDGRDKIFLFNGPIDAYLKLQWEHLEFFRALHPPEDLQKARFHAINACMSAWHLCDWVAVYIRDKLGWDTASALMKVTLANKGDLQKWFRGQGALVACQQIALAYKHVDIDAIAFRTDVRSREGRKPEARGRAYEFVVSTERGDFDLVHVLSVALLVWGDTFTALGIARFGDIDHSG